MAGPFYNNIKGTTAGTPWTGAFTPNAASTGYLAWSTVPTGWIGMVRFEDGTAWELQYSYWNGTTLSRATNQFVSSSSGSALTLTSAATAAMIMDANWVQPHDIIAHRMMQANPASSTFAVFGMSAPTVTGSASSGALATTNMLTSFPRNVYTSATTANAVSAVSIGTGPFVTSSVSGIGGWEVAWRFGCSTLPTGPRLVVGVVGNVSTFTGGTTEPSAIAAAGTDGAMFLKDSTDTNIQMFTGAGVAGTKVDTGIPLTANGWYEARVWSLPGSLTCYFLLIRLDTGAIFYKSTSTTVPASGFQENPICCASLSATTGTAIVLNVGSLAVRSGGI